VRSLRFSAEVPSPRRIGPYRTVKELGRGGMGTEYVAERDNDQYQTKVAINLARPVMDTGFILALSPSRVRPWHVGSTLTTRGSWTGGTTEERLPYIAREDIEVRRSPRKRVLKN
jgi:eukaryotic-like serine/threonine-protein kinase